MEGSAPFVGVHLFTAPGNAFLRVVSTQMRRIDLILIYCFRFFYLSLSPSDLFMALTLPLHAVLRIFLVVNPGRVRHFVWCVLFTFFANTPHFVLARFFGAKFVG